MPELCSGKNTVRRSRSAALAPTNEAKAEAMEREHLPWKPNEVGSMGSLSTLSKDASGPPIGRSASLGTERKWVCRDRPQGDQGQLGNRVKRITPTAVAISGVMTVSQNTGM